MYGLLTSQAGVAVGESLAINSFVCWLFCAITLASANSVLSLWVSCSQSLSRTLCTLAADAAIIEAVFCCQAKMAFSMLLFTPQKPCVISVVYYW